MSFFKKKAKAKDDASVLPPAGRSDSPSLAKMSRSLKRKQKTVVEAKPEIDLSVALPNKDDFRTSLLMPGLSARFSMLREQDDPNTKVGKASDDSVLFPKRVSRLNLFAHNPLTDIAEVESIRSSLIRPPFAHDERSHSFSEGAGYSIDDTAAIMSRSKQVDGNNLFSGRQKMYRIPGVGSNRDLSTSQTSLTSAKHVYQNDVAMSSFQQLHIKEDEAPEHQEDVEERDDLAERPISTEAGDHERSSVVNTPSTGFSKSRGTTSSTASGPSHRRISTAATSLVSDSPVPRQSQVSAGSHSSHAKRTPSEYGRDDDSLRRNPSSESRRGGREGEDHDQPPLPSSPPFTRQLSQSRSMSNLSEEYSRGTSPLPSVTPRASSPPPLQTQGLASLDFGLKSTTHLRRFQTASPTAEDRDGDIYVKNLEPNDRGKATAMGLFNRPSQPFDEDKFQERQLQMHEDRISPPPAVGAHEGDLATQQQVATSQADSKPLPSPPGNEPVHPQEFDERPATGRSRALSASSIKPEQVHAQAEALIKRQNEEYLALQARMAPTESSTSVPTAPETLIDQPVASRGTFLDTFDGSDEEEEVDVDSPMLGRYEPAPRFVPMEVHPALRDGSYGFDFGGQVSPNVQIARPRSDATADTSSPSVTRDTPSTSNSPHHSAGAKAMESLDSPTLGPATGLGLSGLIRTHLRNDSDKSSLMPPPSPIPHPQHSNFSSRHRDPSIASTARTLNPPESTHSDPWEFDIAHRPQRSPMEQPSTDPISTMSQKAQQILGQAMSHRYHAASKAQQVLGSDAPTNNDEDEAEGVQNDMTPSHQRGESTETQKEFGNELAERARRIQEGLKGVAEAEKRSRSPFRPDRPNPAANALHALRHKASKTTLASRGIEPHPKALKMLGLKSGHSPDLRGRNEFAESYDDFGSRPFPRQHPAEFEHASGRQTPGSARSDAYPSHYQEDIARSRQRSATPNTRGPSRGPRRDRGDPEHGERSRSRAGRIREEQTYPPAGNTDSPHPWEHQRPYHGPQGPRVHQGPSRGPPPVEARNYERSASAMSNRRPSASRPGPSSSYFDSRAPTPTMANSPQPGSGPMSMTAPRPSPRPPFPHSPMSPFLQPGMSPGLNGPSSTVGSALPSPVGSLPQPPTSGRVTPVDGRPTFVGMRKKSVVKGMISEPTFISSTSSVPLMGLPNGPRPSQNTPAIPPMNPRRRGNTLSEKNDGSFSPQLPESPMPESPHTLGLSMAAAQRAFIDQKQEQQQKVPRQRNKLRKISSEGGSMAARARNQAVMAEFGREQLRSPALPVFPNRSATSLSMHQDGAMF
ncbi:hypothetical protein LTS07_008631 [Exophiala sideris]|uniref:Uncharacterized protein n=1 Tax=Exophiala sideris TaxID=1016849 RepID=A0ABR0J1I3_9EURO|nr:hypothetical protein LTS07_008631 [Exophiala sideris]KAK5030978.1 hypothetical protein LTR13_007991 [Exophiala sideris]KAK5054073.1 hypothetical protein LTR69_009035 [Exophiala sideris]KAK5179571.1 hypothetical protein LTR44_008087 [Eurotiomycetes sp. CCFEE 6388]